MKVLLNAIVFIIISTGVSAQEQQITFQPEAQGTIHRGKSITQFNNLISFTPANSRWGGSAWMQYDKGYAQFYAGPTFSPAPWIQAGLGAGMERYESVRAIRWGSFLWLGYGRCSAITIYEDSHNSGYWYKSMIMADIGKGFVLGGMVQRYAGFGPRIEFNIPKTPLTIWASFLHDWKTNHENIMVGGKLNLKWGF